MMQAQTVAIIYDLENVPYELLEFSLTKAQKLKPARMIVVSDWDNAPEQKRWKKLLSKEGFTFRQVEREREGENSLDYALAETARLMAKEGVQKFFFVTDDSDFADIAALIRSKNAEARVYGVGTAKANSKLRLAYDKFYLYKGVNKEKTVRKQAKIIIPPEEPEIVLAKGNAGDGLEKAGKTAKTAKTAKVAKATKTAKTTLAKADKAGGKAAASGKVGKTQRTVKAAKASGSGAKASAKDTAQDLGELTVRLPKTLHANLIERAEREGVDLNQMITFVLMQGINS